MVLSCDVVVVVVYYCLTSFVVGLFVCFLISSQLPVPVRKTNLETFQSRRL